MTRLIVLSLSCILLAAAPAKRQPQWEPSSPLPKRDDPPKRETPKRDDPPKQRENPKVKRSYKYVCRHDGCKSKGQVYTFDEITPKEHKCPTCKNRLSRADD